MNPLSPCFIPSPPNGVDAFSLVRKVQGRPSGAGEAPKARERPAEFLPEDTTPASPTRQKKPPDFGVYPIKIKYVHCDRIRQISKKEYYDKKRGYLQRGCAHVVGAKCACGCHKQARLKREIVKEVAHLIIKRIDHKNYKTATDFWDEETKICEMAARLAIELWEKRR